jgi:hypothetical protein
MTFDDELERAFATLADRLRDEISRELKSAAAVLTASALNDREQAASEARAATESAVRPQLEGERGRAVGTLLESLASIDTAGSLSETLDALATAASGHAVRVAILLAGRGPFRGWRFVGFGDAFTNASQITIPLADAGILALASDRGRAVSTDGEAAIAPRFAGLPAARSASAFPLTLSHQTVAVLYADRGGAGAATGETPPGESVAALDILCRFTARKLEALTAFKAAQAVHAGRSDAAPETAGDGQPDPRAEEDESARRYARLLVSEIKLYHEQEVVDGRRDRDLMSRLGGEIARARVMYEQRVPLPVRLRADHFQAELVRTLADGDVGLVETAGLKTRAPEISAGPGTRANETSASPGTRATTADTSLVQ